MSKQTLLWSVTLALGTALPVVAAPTVKATVGHMCCGRCETVIKQNVTSVAWAGTATTERASQSITVMAKDGMPVDVMALANALTALGFPPNELALTGAKTLTMDVGHLCCGGCVGPLQAALAKVDFVESAEVKANSPVILRLKASSTPNIIVLRDTIGKSGYSIKTLVVTE